MAKQPIAMPVNPYLTVKGAADAIAFYQKAFGATENARMPAQDGKRLMHACLTINGGAVMLSDEFPEHAEHGAINAPSKDKPAPVATCLQLAKPAEVDAMYHRAVPGRWRPAARARWRLKTRSGRRALPCCSTRSDIAGC